MIAYKFLRAGAVGPFSRFRWPLPAGGEPGPWVETARLRACREGIHGCTIDQLARWLDRELWRVELDGDLVTGDEQVIGRRGRLLARVDGWDDAAWAALATAGVEHARGLADGDPRAAAYLADAAALAPLEPSTSLYCAAHVALTLEGYAAERRWQSRWLAARLGLGLGLG